MGPCKYHLSPEQFEFLGILTEGSYGKVWKCKAKGMKKIVAAKSPEYEEIAKKEIHVMKYLMNRDLEQHNIVKFYGWFEMINYAYYNMLSLYRNVLVFEMLDMTLKDYCTQACPLPLRDIRTIIQQVARAMAALKRIGVIHSDLHLHNIMLVDHQSTPLRVKLIDFGFAIPNSQAKPGMTLQKTCFRSPEIILGLPFSEAIDMWSLGAVMGFMICGFPMFPASNDYEELGSVVTLLGEPADHLLDNGVWTERYFTRTEANTWRLKTPQEFKCQRSTPDERFIFKSLDEVKETLLDQDKDEAEAYKWDQCFKLLEAMLKLDATERITPSEVLCHPFIVSHPVQGKPSSNASRDDTTTSMQPDQPNPSPLTPPDVLMVPPATPEKRLQLEDEEITDNLQTHNQTSRCEPSSSASVDDDTSIQPDHCSPSPTIKTVQSVVQPATPESMGQLENQESPDSVQTHISQTSRCLSCSTSEDFCLRDGDATNIGEPSTSGNIRTKRKKRCFQCFSSWMRKTFFSCCTSSDKDDEGD